MGSFLLGLLLVFVCLFIIRASLITISHYWLNPRRIKRFMEKQGVYGPKPRFLTGNSRDMSSYIAEATSKDMDSITHDFIGRVLPHYLLWSKQYGKRFIYWVGVEPRMCLTDKEMIKELFSSKCNNITGKSWLQREGSKHFIGGGLLMANGDDWHHQRRVVGRAFMAEKLKNHVGFMTECTKDMLHSLDAVMESGKTEVEIGEYMARVTADIISRTGFDSSYDKGKQMFQLLTKLQHLSAKSNQYLYIPGSRFFPSKYMTEIKSLKAEVENIIKEIIQTRQDSIKVGQSTSYGNDLLSMLLVEMEKGGKGSSFTLQLLIDECKTFFFAGHETTALHLTWTVMLLAANPSWQNKVRAEVFQVCNGETPSGDQLPKLTVLNMVINESLRLYPPVFLFPRMVFEDIELGDLHIPKGLSIWVPELAMNHSEELWGKDVNEFNPERFARNSFSERQFSPFGMGPRNCIGQAFAIMESKIILAMLISRFSFTISKNYRHAPISVITLKPKHGVQINLKPLSP